VACPFCERIARGDLIAENELAAAFPDAYPLSPRHCLIIPRRHEPDFLALTPGEQAAVWALIPAARQHIEATGAPDGYNIGVNVGEAGGQTIEHAHVHVIPRHRGDVADPRGGIRWVLPDKAAYWRSVGRVG
jgi:diadenosine tetraphosphate (Ap4A) HIT family hydrolase